MSHHSRISAVVLALSVASATAGSAGVSSAAGTTPSTSSFLDDGLLLNGRLRYEYADQGGRDDSSALTWRHRSGIQTAGWAGLSELEHTWDLLGEDRYNPSA